MQTSAGTEASPKTALVIGAGIAGCSTAEALARRGWQITLIDRHNAAAQEASGNPAGILHPMVSRDDNLGTRYSRAGYLYALTLLQRLQQIDHSLVMQACGVLELTDTPITSAITTNAPPCYLQVVTQETASSIAGMPVASGGYWYPDGVVLQPASLCMALLKQATAQLTTHWQTDVARIAYNDEHWHAYTQNGHCIARASHLVLANANDAIRLLPEIALTLRPVRGQITLLPSSALAGLKTALCGSGYVTPPMAGYACLGASFIENDPCEDIHSAEHTSNLQHLHQLLPSLKLSDDVTALAGRVAFRSATHDRLPLIGAMPQTRFRADSPLLRVPRQQGLYALLGLGSRGLIWAPLGAEILAAKMNNEAPPLEASLDKAIDPARFHLRRIQR